MCFKIEQDRKPNYNSRTITIGDYRAVVEGDSIAYTVTYYMKTADAFGNVYYVLINPHKVAEKMLLTVV